MRGFVEHKGIDFRPVRAMIRTRNRSLPIKRDRRSRPTTPAASAVRRGTRERN